MGVRDGTARARNLRIAQTTTEAMLWRALRNRRLDGFKFRRQVPIDRYIVDLVCVDAKLIVEIDGGGHADRMDYDAERTAALESRGFVVIRFWNHQVRENLEGVVETIRRALHQAGE